MSDRPDMAAAELREAIEHVERARRLSAIQQGGYADLTLAGASSNLKEVLDREFDDAEGER